MRKLLKVLLAVAMVAPALAHADNIARTKHNFTPSSLFTATVRTSWDEICVFCHTPHNPAGQTKLLWNRTNPTGDGWAAGNTTTMGTQLPTAVSSVSAYCLSCHDGATAIGSVTNTSNRLNPITYSGTNIDAQGRINGTTTKLNTNLQGSHPVSVPYPNASGAGYGSVPNSKAAVGTYNAVVSSGCVGAANCPSGSNAVPLYTDSAGRLGIECGSCHDPHDNTNGSFLRLSNAGSALCLACHIK
jgi:predicted CXXCH cytochrome family protein